MTKHLLTLLTFILLSAFSLQSYACSCVKRTTPEWYSLAKSVFYARIIKAELKEGHGGLDSNFGISDAKYVLGKYQLHETFKGNPPNIGSVIDAKYQGGNCSVGLTVSEFYIIFLYDDNTINLCSGSHRARANDLDKLRTLKNKSK